MYSVYCELFDIEIYDSILSYQVQFFKLLTSCLV